MSLRTLFTLMALVSSAMVAAVIYTKVINPEAFRDPSMAAQRAAVRLCNHQCSQEEPPESMRTQDQLRALHQGCVAACMKRALEPARPEPVQSAGPVDAAPATP